MKVSRIVTKTVHKTVVDDILCNACGDTCQTPHAPGFYGLIEHAHHGGYGSRFGFEDETDYVFSLCEKCLSEIVGRFKIPPEILEGAARRRPENDD